MGLAMMMGVAFAQDTYLVVGTGDLVAKGAASDIAKNLSTCLVPKGSEPAKIDVVNVTNSVALKSVTGRSYAGVVLVPGNGPEKSNDTNMLIVNTNQVAAMRAFIDTVKAKAVVVVELGEDFLNYRRLQEAFAGRAAVISVRDDEARLMSFWGDWAPEGLRRIKLGLECAADPARRDWVHPLPGKVTMEGDWMVIDYETPALLGKSLIVGDTLFRMFYVRSTGRTNWTRIDNAYVDGNRVCLDCSKVKNPGGVRLNWWHLSPFLNIDHMAAPAFVIDLERTKLFYDFDAKLATASMSSAYNQYCKLLKPGTTLAFSNAWKQVLRRDNICRGNQKQMKSTFGGDVKAENCAESFEWILRSFVWFGENGGKAWIKVPSEWVPLEPMLVDPVAEEAWEVPDADIERGEGFVTYRNLPVKETPMFLTQRRQLHLVGETNVRDWKFGVTVEPEDKILFSCGERPELVVRVADKDGQPIKERGAKAVLTWYRDGKTMTNEVVDLTAEYPIRRSMARATPGAVTCEVGLRVCGYIHDTQPKRLVPEKVKEGDTGHLGADGRHNAVKMKEEDYGRGVGCVFDWQKIRPGKPRPADFDAFWDKNLADDLKLPIEVKKMEKIRETKTGVSVYRAVISSLGDDMYAEISIPKGAEEGKKFPIWVIFQAYGCASMWTWTWEWAITIAPNAHSIENGRESEYYKKLGEYGGPLFNYGFDTNENAKVETAYFRKMLLRDIRALRYMMSRPEWNGKDVMFYGSSQGGYQAAAMMGLLPETTQFEFYCPWAIDYGGSQAHWRPKWGEGVQYCDPVHMAHRIGGPVKKIVCNQGTIDTACPVDSFFAWINEMPKDKVDLTLNVFQNKGHNVSPGDKFYRVTITRKPGEEPQVKLVSDAPRCYADDFAN